MKHQVAFFADQVRIHVSSLSLRSSIQGDIYALGKAHMRSTPSLRSFPNVAFETAPMFVWLTMAISRPFKEDRLEEASFNASLQSMKSSR